MKGIYFNKQYRKWHARIYRNGRYFHIGRYAGKDEAIDALNKALGEWAS